MNGTKGDPIEPLSEPERPARVTDAPEEPAALLLTLRNVVPHWRTLNAPKDNGVGRTHKALALFEDAVGMVALSDLKKGHGAAFV